MASTINAISAGAGGIATSADSSGILQLQTNSTTAITVDASQVVTIAGTFNGSNINAGTVAAARLGISGSVVGTTDSQILTGKTITGLKETKIEIAALNVDISLGNYFTKTITAISTLTVSNVPTTGTVASFIIDVTNGGAFAITWWANMKWAAGTVPTLTASGRDILGFFTHDAGTTWNGLVLAKDIK